jgi:two-component system, sensor histidine kinase LadS
VKSIRNLAYFLISSEYRTLHFNFNFIIKIIHKYLIISILSFCSLQLLAQNDTIVFLNQSFKKMIIEKEYSIYDELPNQVETLEEVLKKQNQFRKTQSKVASYFANSSGHWLRFRLKSQIQQSVVLDLALYSTDDLDLYAIDSEGKIKKYPYQNWKTRLELRSIESPRFGYLLELPKDEIITFYLRGKSVKGTYKLSLTVYEPSVFEQNERERLAFYSFFLGLMLIVVLLSVSFFFISKDYSYLYYSLFVIALVVHNLIMGGYLSRFLLNNFPMWADTMNGNLFTPLFGIFNIRFLQLLLLDKQKSPKWVFNYGKIIIGLSILIFVLMLYSVQNNQVYIVIARIFYVYYLALLFNQVLVIAYGFRSNPQNARFVAFSNTPIFVYVLIIIFTNLGLIPPNTSPQFGILSCLLFDIVILCIGLAFRFRAVARRELDLQKQINEQLSRTIEAERKQQFEQIQRLEAQYKLQSEKERISRDLHDNIGSQLTYITSNIDYYSSKLGEDETRHKLNSLSDYVRTTTQQLRDTIWAINNEEIKIGELSKRIKNYSSKQFENDENVDFEFKIDSKIEQTKLSSIQSLNLFRVLQEAINNIKKHSGATNISIEIHQENNQIIVQIKDNGLGFDTTQSKEGHYGLINMKNRIEEIGGSFEIESELGLGTVVLISIENTPKSVLTNDSKN